MTFHDEYVGDDLHPPLPRRNAGSPVGVLTPDLVGEGIVDSTNDRLWVATGTGNTNWILGRGLMHCPNLISMVSHTQILEPTGDTTLWYYNGVSLFGVDKFNEAWATNITHDTEDDGSGDHVPYIAIPQIDTVKLGDALAAEFTLFYQLPLSFGGTWGTNGIRIQTRYVGDASSDGVSASFVLELLDPATGASYSPVKQSSRVAASIATVESGYTWLEFANTILDGLFRPGDTVMIKVTMGAVTAGTTGNFNGYRFGALELNQAG